VNFDAIDDGDRARFVRECALRARCYGGHVATDDPETALDELCRAAAAAQPNPAAADHVVGMEREWACDWLMDPPPPIPQGVQCAIDFRSIFGQESIAHRACFSRSPPIDGWPHRWCLPDREERVISADCLAGDCAYPRGDDEDFCPRHAAIMSRLVYGLRDSGLERDEAEKVVRYVLRRPGSDELDMFLSVLGTYFPAKDRARVFSRARARVNALLEERREDHHRAR
jgi:hypothetical protein